MSHVNQKVNQKLLIASVHKNRAPEVVAQIHEIMGSSHRIQLETSADIKKLYPILKNAAHSVVLLTLTSNSELMAMDEFLKTFESFIQDGRMRVLAINNFSEPKNLQSLLARGCAEIILPAISVVDLLTRIQEGVAALDSPVPDTPLGELGICPADLEYAKSEHNDFEYLEKDERPWKKGAEAFKSIELMLKMKRAVSKPPNAWFEVILIENDEKNVLIEIPKSSNDRLLESPLALDEEITLHVLATNGDPALNFKLFGKITAREPSDPASLTTISITPISGTADKLKTLADLFSKRQNEVQDFLKAVKGI